MYNSSTGSLEFYCGVDSHCKTLQTSASETWLTQEKPGRCPSTMSPRITTTSLCHRLLRKISTPVDVCHVHHLLPCFFIAVYCMLFSTQLPQSVGVAYSLKMDGKKACAVAFTGDGGTSEVTAQ